MAHCYSSSLMRAATSPARSCPSMADGRRSRTVEDIVRRSLSTHNRNSPLVRATDGSAGIRSEDAVVIVVGVDGSPSSARAVSLGAGVARQTKSVMVAVHLRTSQSLGVNHEAMGPL